MVIAAGGICFMTPSIAFIKIIGLFRRNDGDHKFIAVTTFRNINDYSELTEAEKLSLHNLYPRCDEGEGWFGKDIAYQLMKECEKPL